MNLMNNEQRKMQRMLQYVGWKSFVLSLMIVQRELKRYPNAEVVWCQEEPMNMGGYTYILPRLITSMKAVGRGGYEDVKYAGRAPSATTATGFLKVHLNEQAELVQKAIQREPINFPLLRHSIYIVSPE
ncbi:hypothetical protein GYH30_029477 [Glycine max]|nr:hypothetical protein GYH30_029477 [Glycine max]